SFLLFNDPAPPEIYTLSLHDALPISLSELGGAEQIIVDMHAEATSEKVAMGWHLDGRVTAVVGTHTHVPTADARVLPGGTAYITDRKSTRLNSSHVAISYAVFCLKKK